MRKAIALFAVLIGAFGVIGLAGASPASASNCDVVIVGGAAGIYWQNTWFPGGDLYYQHRSQNCTDVDLVEFNPYQNGNPAAQKLVGIVDLSDGLVHYIQAPPTVQDVLCGRQYTTLTTQCGWTGHVPVYCGGLVHVVYTTSQFRIHSKAQQSWGPWHGVGSPNQSIAC